MSGTTVTADPTKGSIELYRDADQMMYFVWRNRSTNALSPNDEYVVVPGDYTWKRVHQCNTGRVYLLSFYGEKRFFWMQEPNADKDAEICANLRREIGDSSVEVVAPAAEAQAPESNVAGSSSGDNASLYD